MTSSSPATPDQSSSAAPAAAAKPAAKVKPPAPEDKPFATFVPELLLPAIAQEVQTYGGPAPSLRFEEGPIPVVGGSCWLVAGELPGERRFWLAFTEPDINASKLIAVAEGSAAPTLLESFLIDERKMTLPLLVSRVVQRLNAQKWLGPN